MESNAFNYHLKEIIKEGFVIKDKSGNYTLTRLGMRLGLNAHLSLAERLSLSHAVIFMTVFDRSKGWLVRRRTAHPMFGRIGFVHGDPLANETVLESATRCFEKATGLKSDFRPRGFGYAKFFADGELESYNNFSVFSSENYTGDLIEGNDIGENIWMSEKELLAEPNVFSNMKPILEAMKHDDLFFLDIRGDM